MNEWFEVYGYITLYGIIFIMKEVLQRRCVCRHACARPRRVVHRVHRRYAMQSVRKVTYAYDHVGRNVMKDGARYIWDDYNIIAENAGAENVTCNTWGLDLDGTMQGLGGVGGLLAVVRDGDCTIPAYDGNGNITEYISDDGTIVFHSDYSSFGRERLTSGDNNYSHRFSTKPTCRKTRLLHYQLRTVSAIKGAWTSLDPIYGEPVLNGYSYCDNKPIHCVDVYGYSLWPEWLPSGDDYYGNYGGEKRINGKIYPPDQKDENGNYLKRSDIGPPKGPEPVDCFDRCYMEHDRCIADANDRDLTPCGQKDAAKKDCDIALSACLAGCAIVPLRGGEDSSVTTILKGWPLGIIAMPVMPILAHPKGWLPPKGPTPPMGPMQEPSPWLFKWSF